MGEESAASRFARALYNARTGNWEGVPRVLHNTLLELERVQELDQVAVENPIPQIPRLEHDNGEDWFFDEATEVDQTRVVYILKHLTETGNVAGLNWYYDQFPHYFNNRWAEILVGGLEEMVFGEECEEGQPLEEHVVQAYSRTANWLVEKGLAGEEQIPERFRIIG